MRNENLIFADYQTQATPELEAELVKALRRHGYAVMWEVLKQFNPDLVNWGVFLALRRADTFRGESKFSTWFHQIMLNLCLRYARDSAPLKKEVQLPEDLDGVGEVYEADISGLLVEQIKSGLVGEDLNLLELYLLGLSHEEIAGKMGLETATVRLRWHRLRQQLKEEYGNRYVCR